MFGLRVNRPRLFEASVPLGSPPHAPPVRDPIGVYGRQPDGRRLFTRKDGTKQRAARGLAEGREAMGIEWMDWRDLTEAIPPAYTEWIGRQLLSAVIAEAA
jgi:DNA (cytosine-5)-methyltransferase 1